MSALLDELDDLRACMSACNWVRAQRLLTPEQLWERCRRADWLLWYADRVGVDRRLIARAACDCARTVLHLVPGGESLPLRAIEAAEEWCDGRGTIEQALAARAAVVDGMRYVPGYGYTAHARDAVLGVAIAINHYVVADAARYADRGAGSAERVRLVRERIPYAVVAAAREARS